MPNAFRPLLRARECRAALLLLAGVVAGAPRVAAAQDLGGTRTGVVSAVWDDGADPTRPRFVLVDRSGTATPLLIDDAALAAAGGVDRVDRQEVTVQGDRAGGGALRVRSLRLTRPSAVRAPFAASASVAGQPIGPLSVAAAPFITLLCRFADTPQEMVPARDRVTRTYASTYPGARHFFTEQAFGADVLAGSAVAPGWVTIGTRGSYLPNPQTFDYYGAARDCTAAAEAAGTQVSGFYGINFQFSGALSVRSTPPFDPLSLGGSFSRYTPAGALENFGATWLSSEHVSQYVVVEHEMGHALGWPHSEFVFGREYDSEWDVMSVGYIGFTPEFGYVPSGTIAPNKARSGWITPAAMATPNDAGTVRTAHLRGLALPWPGPADTSAYVGRVLAVGGNGCEYMVESRLQVGYDKVLPGTGVIIHQPCGRPRLIAPPGVQSGGRAAAWQPGSTFADSVGGVYVRVDSATATGHAVTLTRGWPLLVRLATTGVAGGAVRAGGAPCTRDCTVAAGARGQAIEVVPTPAAGAMFLGWEGACTGSGGCAVAMHGAREVTARFGAAVAITTTGARRRGTVGVAYADTLRATGGTGEYAWAVTGGALPAGLTLDAATGVVRGTPSNAGTVEFTLSATSLGSTATGTVAVTIARAAAFASDSLRPPAVRGRLYADTLRLEGDPGGVTWAVTGGALPEGIRLDATTGIVTGTPGAAGLSRFTVTATAVGTTVVRTFVLRVRQPTVVTSETARRAGLVGVAYADTLRAEHEPGATVTWAVVEGALPEGLSLAPESGIVRGVPTAAGEARFVASATADGLSATREFTLSVTRTLTITSDSLRRRAVVGVAYADTLRSNADTRDARWSVTGGALPAGLALDPETGVVSGTPTAAGTARFTAAVAGGGASAAREFVVAVLRPTVIAGDSVRRPALRGAAYADTLRAEGDGGAVTWRVTAGALPAGLTLAATTGVLSGVPTAAGTARFTVQATSEIGAPTRALVLSVLDVPQIVSEVERRGSVIGEPYADTLRLTGGVAAGWTIVDGALPPGLTLAATGVVSGVAERAGTFRFTVEVAAPVGDRRTFTMTVVAPTLAAADVLGQLLGGGATLPAARVTYLDLIGNRNGRLDVGDVRAWLVSTGALAASAPLADVMPTLERAVSAPAPSRTPTPDVP